MRPHFWRTMSRTTARDRAIGALVWTATKSFHCSGVTSQNLIGFCRLSLRMVAWPTPALLTRMSIAPKRLRALETMSSIDSSRARSASIVIRLASCCRCCAALGELGETLGGAVDRGDSKPCAEQAQHHLAANAAGGTGHDRHALLFAHRLLPFL